jgi:hypothetical protein
LDNTVVVALGITVVGMSLLFLTLVLFYGLLTLLTKVLQDREPGQGIAVAGEPAEPGADDAVFQAAALAVALARAEFEVSSTPGRGLAGDVAIEGQQVNPWWALHHQRQLTPGSEARRTR